MAFHQWKHNIRMYLFSDEKCFSKTVLICITFTWCINQLSVLNTFSFISQAFLLISFINHYSTSTYQLHQFSSTSSLLINFNSVSFETWIFWQLPSCFRVSSYFLSFFRCYEFWLPCIRLSLLCERYLSLLHNKINNQIEFKMGNTGTALEWGMGSCFVLKL